MKKIIVVSLAAAILLTSCSSMPARQRYIQKKEDEKRNTQVIISGITAAVLSGALFGVAACQEPDEGKQAFTSAAIAGIPLGFLAATISSNFIIDRTNDYGLSGEWKDGRKEGVWTAQYPDGTPKVKLRYREGKKHGEYIEYYENGQVWIEESYKNDDKNGLSREYYKSGYLKKQEVWKKGELKEVITWPDKMKKP